MLGSLTLLKPCSLKTIFLEDFHFPLRPKGRKRNFFNHFVAVLLSLEMMRVEEKNLHTSCCPHSLPRADTVIYRKNLNWYHSTDGVRNTFKCLIHDSVDYTPARRENCYCNNKGMLIRVLPPSPDVSLSLSLTLPSSQPQKHRRRRNSNNNKLANSFCVFQENQ